MSVADPSTTLRPRDLALLLLASGDLRPRVRARDQQADAAGLDLKRRVLERVAALDPEPEQFEAALARIIEALGPPTGPTRGIAATIRDDWLAARASSVWVAQLLTDAVDAAREK